MTTETPSLRERRRAATEDDIAGAALRLAAERGWAETTVDDIATAAGISRRTFFNYFPAKEDALLHAPGGGIAGDLPDFEADPAPFPEAVEHLLVGWSRHLAEDRSRLFTMMSVVEANPELLPQLLARFHRDEELIAAAIRRRENSVDSSAARTLSAIIGAVFRTACHDWAHGEDTDAGGAVVRALAAARLLG